jgi:hypothetical protein
MAKPPAPIEPTKHPSPERRLGRAPPSSLTQERGIYSASPPPFRPDSPRCRAAPALREIRRAPTALFPPSPPSPPLPHSLRFVKIDLRDHRRARAAPRVVCRLIKGPNVSRLVVVWVYCPGNGPIRPWNCASGRASHATGVNGSVPSIVVFLHFTHISCAGASIADG